MKIKKITLFIFVCFFLGCSSTPSTERVLSDFAPETLRIRRPEGAGADPKAEPGMPEYEAQKKPNAKFDCQYPHELFMGVSMLEIRSCLNELYAETKKTSKPIEVLYRLKRGPVSHLELDGLNDADFKSCLKQALPKISVPREIMYQGYEVKGKDQKILCYASRMNIEANQWMGLELPMAKWALKLSIPLPSAPDAPPATDDELQRTLVTWALTPFRDESGHFRAKIVPDAICRQCLGEKGMLKKPVEDAFFWPGP